MSADQSDESRIIDYFLHPSGLLTASKYGHPIGSWCVEDVEDLGFAFSAFDRGGALKISNDAIDKARLERQRGKKKRQIVSEAFYTWRDRLSVLF